MILEKQTFQLKYKTRTFNKKGNETNEYRDILWTSHSGELRKAPTVCLIWLHFYVNITLKQKEMHLKDELLYRRKKGNWSETLKKELI